MKNERHKAGTKAGAWRLYAKQQQQKARKETLAKRKAEKAPE